ncbi:unnamed protein product [Allacma fusca]|uniref:SWIM-type domain-containing protein n=1 Tax=Allacma fusca TaxID=39272 RepID=A0A8J2JN57_9HEXA|nr:unnamed protein product [Allacma fusca]
MRCKAGGHNVRDTNVHRRTITADLIRAYKHCCMVKNNCNDEVEINEEVQVCTSCWIIICREQRNPTAVVYDEARDNMFFYNIPKINRNECFICSKANPLYMIPFSCRVDFFIKTGLFLPRETKCCRDHTTRNEKGFLIDVHFLQIEHENGIALMSPAETRAWFEALRTSSGTVEKSSTQNRILSMNDDDFRQVIVFVATSLLLIIIGPQAHPRPDCLSHVNELSKRLHLTEDNQVNAVLIVDGTYIYIPKSGNFTVLKRSYSTHKGRHLLKMNMFVFPDGRIFDVQGPYLSDGKNNDAATLKHDLKRDITGIKNWLVPGDVMVVDRGYRDAVGYLGELGFSTFIPFCAPANMKQIPTVESNKSRITTKTRWIVEARNGHVSQIFKYFGRSIHAASVPFVGDYFRICCAIINAYYPTIEISLRSQEQGNRLLEIRDNSNTLQEYLVSKDLLNPLIRRVWREMNDEELEGFPRMDVQELQDLVLSVFQIKLASSYTASQDYIFQVFREEATLLRVKMWSRHSASKWYMVFIKYIPNENGQNGIRGWYCTCKGGARTAGMCSHCCAILWYLCYARYEPVIPGPSNRVLEIALDAAGRYGNVQVVEDGDNEEPGADEHEAQQ